MHNSVIWPRVAVSIIFLLLIVFALFDANDALRYSRVGLEQGEYWRLVTGHWVHLNGAHCLLNLAALAIMVWVLGVALPVLTWIYTGVFLCLFISLCLYFFSPAVMWYVGFSGVLHGLFFIGTVSCIRSSRDFVFILVSMLLIGKVVWEQMAGFDANHLQAIIRGRVVADAHLYGVVGGSGVLLARYVRQRLSLNAD